MDWNLIVSQVILTTPVAISLYVSWLILQIILSTSIQTRLVEEARAKIAIPTPIITTKATELADRVLQANTIEIPKEIKSFTVKRREAMAAAILLIREAPGLDDRAETALAMLSIFVASSDDVVRLAEKICLNPSLVDNADAMWTKLLASPSENEPDNSVANTIN